MSYISVLLKSDLCAGSGEAYGQSVDSDVCYDANGFPYIPARRLKGCLREAALSLLPSGIVDESSINEIFGAPGSGASGSLSVKNAVIAGSENIGAQLKSKGITADEVLGIYTDIKAQTALTEQGCADEESLRFTRVINHFSPSKEELEFTAEVSFDKKHKETLENICKAFRHMGMNRTRGLGAVECRMNVTKDKADAVAEKIKADLTDACAKFGAEDYVTIEYFVRLDAPLTMPKIGGGILDRIEAKSAIGCFAGNYLKSSDVDSLFNSLFLNGDVCWSDICVSDGEGVFSPAPLFLVKKKYLNKAEDSHFANSLAEDVAPSLQPKHMDTKYACKTENAYKFMSPKTRSAYHHSTGENSTLYVQESLEEKQIFAGTVTFKAKYKEAVISLLTESKIAFGRSRSAQYASCSLVNATASEKDSAKISLAAGKRVYAVLKSNLSLPSGKIDAESAACAIAEEIGAREVRLLTEKCSCLYAAVSGFNTMWRLQKPSKRVIKAGSFYCFEAASDIEIPRRAQIGENKQEGFGCIEFITAEEMIALNKVYEAENTAIIGDLQESSPLANEVEAALADKKAKSESLKKAYEFFAVNKSTLVGKFTAAFIGRVALMLDESTSDENFTSRIESIKDKKKKEGILGIYGGLKKMLGDSPCFIGSVKPTMNYVLVLTKYAKREEGKE